MAWFSVRPCVLLEIAVMMCQVAGVGALCLYRLFPGTSWARRGRIGFILALFGLGISGALCGRNDSEFALFAGLTMTALLIGMTMGGSLADSTDASVSVGRTDGRLIT
jgi:hypothetical protein